jgi:membrane associated rhomboid family serine protease
MPAASDSDASSPQKTWASYLDTILPLITGFLVVPLEDTRDAPQWLRELYALSPVTAKFAHEHLVFSRSAWTEGRYYTAVTHCFSHENLSHLFNNISSLVFAGKRVYVHTPNAFEFYLIFFSSVGASAYLTTLKDELQLMPMAQSFVPRNPFPSSWGRLHGWYDGKAGKVTRSANHFFSQYVKYRGASAGVFGLIGASAVIQIEEFWAWGREMWVCYRQGTRLDSAKWRRLGLSFLGLGKEMAGGLVGWGYGCLGFSDSSGGIALKGT